MYIARIFILLKYKIFTGKLLHFFSHLTNLCGETCRFRTMLSHPAQSEANQVRHVRNALVRSSFFPVSSHTTKT